MRGIFEPEQRNMPQLTLDQIIEKDHNRRARPDELKEKISKLKERNSRFGDCETSNL